MDPMNPQNIKPPHKHSHIIWYILDVLEGLLLFRFVLKFLGANPHAGFTDFIYTITNVFAAPFINVFKISYVQGSIFEWTTLLAMFVYWILAKVILKMFFVSKIVSSSGVTSRPSDLPK